MNTTIPTHPQPPLGPLEVPPEATPADAGLMLDDTLARIQQGAFDTTVRGYAANWHPALQVTVASWMRRSWDDGVRVGREERAEEVADQHARITEARAALDRARGRQA